MNIRSVVATLAVLSALSVLPGACASPDSPPWATKPRDLTGMLEPIRQRSGLPALGAAVVTSAGLEAIGATGLRSWGADPRVTVDDQWHIGSCTKAMTATLSARLVERGDLAWDTTVGDVFGPTIHAGWRDVTLLMLLCHRSGASMNFEQDLWERTVARGGSPREQRAFFVREGLAVAPTTTPDTETVYSNAGVVVAGAMLEARAGASWEELMAREVFEPLGLTRTGFGAPGTPGKLDEPLGHTRGTDGWTPVELGPNADNPALSGPTGTIHTTLADWARFVAAHLRGERGDTSYLATATWQRLHSPGGTDWGYSPGWVVTEADWAGGKLLRHLGSNGFWVAEASIAPRADCAVLIVTNVGDDAAEAAFRSVLESLVAEHAGRGR